MKKEIIEFINSYKSKDKEIDKNASYYDLLITQIPNKLHSILHNDEYYIKGSIGQGNTAEIPWVCIFNTKITRTAQRGIYIVILFKKDMSGFYLTLNQGITNFDEKYKSKAKSYASKVSNYFREQIGNEGHNFDSKNTCNLGGNSRLAKGYEATCILQKFYDVNFDEEKFIVDLQQLSSIYDEIASHIDPLNSYDEIVKNILVGYDLNIAEEKANDALDNMMSVIKKHMTTTDQKLIPVNKYAERTRKYRELTQPLMSKYDYVEKAEINAVTGLNGERLALEYEMKRLESLIRQNKIDAEYLDKVKHISQQTDSAGYDILSYDIDKNGEPHPIYIEVKTTTNKKDTYFFASKNEVNKSKQYQDHYCVFRIYDSNSNNPKYYLANGELEKNFDLDPITYRCTYKYAVA